MKNLILRLCMVPVTFIFLLGILQIFDRIVFGMFFIGFSDFKEAFYYYKFTEYFLPGILAVWFVAQIIFEIRVRFNPGLNSLRIVKNLRYAPIAALIFSWFVVLAFDQGMIQYSRWRISNYVFQNSTAIEEPDFRPHVNYRGWCGNGYTAVESELYFDLASSGIDDVDPYVRSRSLLMAYHVRDFLNGSDVKRLAKITKKACTDQDEIVRSNAESILHNRNSTCSKLINDL